MKLVAWFSIIVLAGVACKGEGKSPFMETKVAPPAAAGAATAGSAAAPTAAAGSAAGSAAAGSAAAGSATAAVGSGAGSGSAVVEPLKVGDRVQAQWTNGRWYPGKIAAITDAGTYDINYNDGDKSKGLPESKVRRPTVAKAGGGGGGGKSTASSSDAPCPGPGLTRRCNGTCVNIQENNNHCGSCNNRCPSGKSCDGHMFCRDAEGNL